MSKIPHPNHCYKKPQVKNTTLQAVIPRCNPQTIMVFVCMYHKMVYQFILTQEFGSKNILKPSTVVSYILI